jgi:hypothetical protein
VETVVASNVRLVRASVVAAAQPWQQRSAWRGRTWNLTVALNLCDIFFAVAASCTCARGLGGEWTAGKDQSFFSFTFYLLYYFTFVFQFE